MTRDAMENVVLAGLREHFEGDIVPLAILDEISKHDEAQREDIARLKDILGSVDQDHAVEKLHNQIATKDEEIAKLQDNLDQVLGEAVSVAQMATSFSVEECPIMVNEALQFLDSPLVQAYRARQPK